MSTTYAVSGKHKPISALRLLLCLVALMLTTGAKAAAQEEPLRWFNYFFDTVTTLAYGIQDSDHVPLFFECERGNPIVGIHVDHEPVHVQDGQETSVRLHTTDVQLELQGTAHYQSMDDLMRVEARMVVDGTLQRLLAHEAILTITIEEQAVGYPLVGVSKPAAKLLDACLATPEDALLHKGADSVKHLSHTDIGPAILHGITEVDLAALMQARPDLTRDGGPRLSGVQTSPDGSMLALLLPSRDIDFPDQIWLYQRADHSLIPATPPPSFSLPPYPDGTPAAVKSLAWQEDTLYARIALWTQQGQGEEATTAVYAATMSGSQRLAAIPDAIYILLDEAGQPGVVGQDEVSESEWDFLDTMQGNSEFLVWPYDAGDGQIELRWRQRIRETPWQVAAQGGAELRNYLFDAHRSLLVYPSDVGIILFDIDNNIRQGVLGTLPGDQPLALSDDGNTFVWSRQQHCGEQDHTEAKSEYTTRYCVARLSASLVSTGPGFDCTKASRQIDRAICRWEHISTFDREMNQAYQAALAAQEEGTAVETIKASQKAWLSERDSRCALDKVAPDPNSDEGLSPQDFGQMNCLYRIYPPRIVQLTDLAVPPFVPLTVTTLPLEPLRAAYPDRWGRLGYRAQFSADGSMLYFGVEGQGSGQTAAVWVYFIESGEFRVAAPHEAGADLTEALTRHEHADDSCYDPGPHNQQEAKTARVRAWTMTRRPGYVDLFVSDASNEERIVSSGRCDRHNYLLDPAGEYIYLYGEDGLLTIELATGVKRRIQGTYGSLVQTRLLAVSPLGDLLAFAANGSCTRDATMESDPEADEDEHRRLCLAQIRKAAEPSGLEPTSDVADTDPWSGAWSAKDNGQTSARIRRGMAKPDYLVISLVTGRPGCSGAVTLYGKPEGRQVLAQSYDANDPSAPLCHVSLLLDAQGSLRIDEVGDCGYYHGGGCIFDSELTKNTD